ncbi:protein PROCA1 isoform X2 [Antechinus flavipes]|uniref:protein PROCA1 isoform X2 n=1 Tax=Antechinus flavipes TaxID=38775 RepID=UPI0022364A65|nr:protein PROCA1 isoform X2 [Antechinus flavipes]
MSARGCWLGLPLLLTAVAGGLGAAPHRAKRGFTYPGTLWCGAGNNAESYEQLGELEETDRCCREHDQCQQVIHPFTIGYGHHNFRWHTISHCDCDARLKACLRQVNDAASRAVGQAFFNVIQVPCFELTYEEQCVERYWCKSYGPRPRAVLQDPALYEFGGPTLRVPPPGSTTPPGRPPRSRRVRLPTATQGGKGAWKGKKKEKRTKKKGLSLTPPGWEPRLGREPEEGKSSVPPGQEGAAPDWGAQDRGSNDILQDELEAEGPAGPPRATEVKAMGRSKGRRKGRRGRNGPGKSVAPSTGPSLS